MKFNELNIGTYKAGKRVGRGISAGQGKTAGRGTKGQKSRTGSSAKPGFEGGQNPLMQRLPKLRGFKSVRVPATNVYTGQLDAVKGSVNNQSLAEAGIVPSAHVRVKLVVKGDITKKLDVKLQAASDAAIALIQKAGGTFEVVPQLGRVKLEKNAEKNTRKSTKTAKK
jgi:large subunit ribosomal protein L15